ncbi:MAG: phosphopantetheine-binding protein, partial [Desulfatirhabdiaceae bacterium]
IPVLSNMTGQPFSDASESVRHILSQQLISPVNFVQNILELYERGVRTFLEVGPKPVLTGLVRTTLKSRDHQALSMDASSGKHSGILDLARTLSALAALGHPVRLDLWQSGSHVAQPRKQAMNIPISGANYKNPIKPEKQHHSNPLLEIPPVSPFPRQSFTTIDSTETQPARHTPIETVMQNDSPTKQNRAKNPFPIDQALQVVQEGLRSLQTLQLQTAEAHKLFLQTQAETGRSLQKILDQTPLFIELSSASGSAVVRPSTYLPQTENAAPTAACPETQGRAEPQSMSPVETISRSEEPALRTQTAFSGNPPPLQPPAPHLASQIEIVLLKVVSQLTGYPEDMLGLDMDIEADLGIDSIKRVEILAAMEEAMPGLPSVPTDVMAGLKTLGQVAVQLSGSQSAGPAGFRPVLPQANLMPDHSVRPESVCDSNPDIIQHKLLAVVSQLTGYPVDMLGLDMDIEADLGIDSIKRVEILSAMEEAMPDLPAIAPDVMAGLKTLRHIVSLLHENKQ